MSGLLRGPVDGAGDDFVRGVIAAHGVDGDANAAHPSCASVPRSVVEIQLAFSL